LREREIRLAGLVCDVHPTMGPSLARGRAEVGVEGGRSSGFLCAAGGSLAFGGRFAARDGSAFVDELGEFVEGTDNGGVIATAGVVESGFRGGDYVRREMGEGTVDVGADDVELGTDDRVGFEIGDELSASVFDEFDEAGFLGRGLLGIDVDKALSGLLGKVHLLEDREVFSKGFFVKGLAFGEGEVGVGFRGSERWLLRERGGLPLRSRHGG
jgi:hypothetical protein